MNEAMRVYKETWNEWNQEVLDGIKDESADTQNELYLSAMKSNKRQKQ